MNLVYYDTETTGTDKVFNQTLQFGAIRTEGV
jgi:exonuclease I